MRRESRRERPLGTAEDVPSRKTRRIRQLLKFCVKDAERAGDLPHRIGGDDNDDDDDDDGDDDLPPSLVLARVSVRVPVPFCRPTRA